MDDNFIRAYIGELLRSLRTQYLIDLIKPYTRLELSFLAKVSGLIFIVQSNSLSSLKQLNVEIEEVEELLIGLILEGKVEGRIDQVGMRLELDRKSVLSSPSGSSANLTNNSSQTKLGEKAIRSVEQVDGCT